jgi:hypothetical protein
MQPGPEGPPGPEPVPGYPQEPVPGGLREREPATTPSEPTPHDPMPGPEGPQDAEPATTPSEPTPQDLKPGPEGPQDAEPATTPSEPTPQDPHRGPEDPPGPGQPQAGDPSPEGFPPQPDAPRQEARAARFSPAPWPGTGLRLRHAGVRRRSRSAHVAAGPPECLAALLGSEFRVRRSLREHGEEAADRRSHLPCGHPPGAPAPKRRVRGQRNTLCSVNSTGIAVCHGQIT